MAELLPADLMFDILLRLPVKTLVRCRRVSKGWRDLIDSRYFAKLHSNNPPSLLILHHLPDHKAYDVVDLNSVWKGGSCPLAFKQFPVRRQDEILYNVEHCNGLFCITDPTDVLLWNPATGKQFRFGLPRPGHAVRDWGFGYDKDSDDYKVVAVGNLLETAVWIYSLRSRSWKCIDDFPYEFVYQVNRGVFVSGALHWRVQRGATNDWMIIALHLGKLEYNLVPMPDYNSEHIGKCLEGVGVLDGRLWVTYYGSKPRDFDLWIMKEYGVKESWTKLIGCSSTYLGACRLVPLAYLQNKEVLLFHRYNYYQKIGYEYNEMVEYKFKTRSFGRPYGFITRSCGYLNNNYCSFTPYVYAPSLVSPQIDI